MTAGTQQSAFLAQVVRAYTDSIPSQTSLDFSKYRKLSKEAVRIDEEPFWVLQSLSRSCDLARQWTEKLSGVARLSSLERDRLFFGRILDLVVLRTALRMQEGVERIVLCNSLVFHRSQMAYVLTGGILQQVQELAGKLKQPDHAASAMLSALCLLQDASATSTVVSQQTSTTTDLFAKLKEILKEYCQQLQVQSPHAVNFHAQLVEILAQTQQIAAQLKQRLKQCNVYNNSVYPLCIPTNSMLDLL